jgi:NADH:ubiquinone oxidoreductase subunit 2 (subunit N)
MVRKQFTALGPALRQTSAKRLLAYSSIGQVGYMLVGVAAASQNALAIPGLLFSLVVYLLMNLGAFLAIDAIERQLQTDDLRRFAGIGRRLPLASAVLTMSLLALAGFLPFGSFVGKTLLFGAVLVAGWTWLALVMLANIMLSLFYYVRVLISIYLQPGQKSFLSREAPRLRATLLVLGLALLMSGVFPQMGVEFATHASSLFLASSFRWVQVNGMSVLVPLIIQMNGYFCVKKGASNEIRFLLERPDESGWWSCSAFGILNASNAHGSSDI